MKISDLMKMGLRNLFRRKARTFLTVLGVIIGTVSIVVMVSIGAGMKKSYTSGVMESGSLTKIIIRTWHENYDSNNNYIDSKEQKLTKELAEQIKFIDHVKAVTPVINSYAHLSSGKYQSWVSIYAVDFSTMQDFDFPEPVDGKLPTGDNFDTFIVGALALANFYNPSSRNFEQKEMVLGQDKIILEFNDYQVNERKKPFSMELKNAVMLETTNDWQYDYSIWTDITYFKQIYQKYANTLTLEDRKRAVATLNNYAEIWVNVDNIDHVLEVQNEITKLGYGSSSKVMDMKPMQETSDMIQIVLLCIGCISLFVSAINIANTMVMSIYERTKEIGIMKVLGCQVKDVKKLFLYEAALIGLMGGVIGILLSYILSWVINKFGGPIFAKIMSSNYMYDASTATYSYIPWYLPFFAALITIGVGLISGYLPARRATKISAIEAMKTES